MSKARKVSATYPDGFVLTLALGATRGDAGMSERDCSSMRRDR